MMLAVTTFRDVFLPLVYYLDSWVLTMLGIYASCFLFQIGAAFFELRRSQREGKSVTPWWLLTSKVTIPISILVPAHNEEKTIVENVRSLLSLHYPDFEVLVVNDGSKDNTLAVLRAAFDLKAVSRAYPHSLPCKPIRGIYVSGRYPKLAVVDKLNGGKSDAFNAGLNLSRNPLVCMVDADSMLESDSLLRLVRPFILEPDEMVAVGGRIRVVNGCEVRSGRLVRVGLPREFLPLVQTVEYIRSFQIARLSWSRMQSVTIISGAFGLFKRAALMKVGGYAHDTVGEDMEVTVKLHRYYLENRIPYKMSYLADPVCWTEVPATLKILRNQRTRWARGMLEVLFRHRAMILSPRYGMPGMFGLGYFFLFDAIGPIIELLGYIIIPTCWLAGILNLPFFLSYLGLLFMFGVFVSVGSLFLEEVTTSDPSPPQDLLILTLCAFAENFGYRQLNSWWRIKATYQFLRKKRGWGVMTRAGFSQKPAQKAA
jgi:cellulose synthase/poly-beta-1,6-N-acetylglucosamine synthase-like glycosyltransferase